MLSVLRYFWMDIDLSHKGKIVKLEEKGDRRNCEFGCLPPYDAARGFVKNV